MRILVVCSHYPPRLSPESNHAALLCAHLAQDGAEVHLLTSPLLAGAPGPNGFLIHPVMPTWGWAGAVTLVRTVARLQPDVLLLIYVGWIYDHHPMITFAPSLLKFCCPRTAFVTQFENTLGARWSSRWARLTGRIATACLGGSDTRIGTLLIHSDRLIMLSDAHRAALAAIAPEVWSKSVVIAPPPLIIFHATSSPARRAEGRQRLGFAPADPTSLLVTFFGYVYRGKGVETLLRAAALIKSRRPAGASRFQVAIVGRVAEPDLDQRLQALEQQLGLDHEIIWAGHQENEAASACLWASDLAVLPFDDGVHLNNSSFAVCAWHRLPIITTRGESTEGAFRDGENTLLCPPRDPLALAAAIELLLDSPERRRRLGEGSHAMARTLFSWDRAVELTRATLRAASQPCPV